MSLAMPDIDSDTFILSDLDFESQEPCDWQEDCQNKAEWLVLCGECRRGEAICTPHCMELKERMTRIEFVFNFNHTCGHQVPARSCPIVPMS